MISVFVAISLLSFALIAVSTNLQLTIRGLTAGESTWAKMLHETIFHLDRFAEAGTAGEREAYHERLVVLNRYGELRELLRSGGPSDSELALQLAMSIGEDPARSHRLVRTVQRYRDYGFMQHAFERWEAAEVPVLAVAELGTRIEAEWEGGAPDPEAIAALRSELVEIRSRLRPTANDFGRTMSAAGHDLRTVTLWLAAVSVGSMVALGLLLAWSVLYRINESEQRFRHMLNTANDGVAAIDPVSGRILGCNHKLSKLTGRSERGLIGRLYRDLFPRHEREHLADSHGYLQDGVLQAHLLHRDGNQTPVEVSASYTMWDEREAMVVIIRDVTERRAHERRIEFLAAHDSLTGLVNRREFERQAEALIDDRRAGTHALMYLDLDQFKVVNDTCGHAAGDELLRQLTARLRRCVRDTDTLARLGGDEFGVLLVDCSIEQAQRIAAKLTSMVNEWQFAWGARRFTIGVSIGIVPLKTGGPGLTALLSAADAACYAAKDAGRNRTVVYTPGAPELLARQGEMHWVSRLNEALADGRLELHRQRIVAAQEGGERPEGDHWELLVRLRDDDGSLVEPDNFLPAAERFNLAPELDRRVFDMALRGMRAALDQGASSPADIYSINLSGATLGDGGFAAFVEDAFTHWKVPPSMVCFEITETAAIASIEAARAFITRMRELGSRIALDDFGTGMSSFAYLRGLPVDYLKIDGSFVRDLSTDRINAAMVRVIHELSREIGIRTIAESVEDRPTLDALRALGGDLAQGYALHRPEPWRWGKPGAD